jgi:NAD(P)H-nitrite reductase large subunit
MSPRYFGRRKVLCHCLQVAEQEVVEAIVRCGLRSVGDVRCETGAGEGCTACHQAIREHLQRHG